MSKTHNIENIQKGVKPFNETTLNVIFESSRKSLELKFDGCESTSVELKYADCYARIADNLRKSLASQLGINLTITVGQYLKYYTVIPDKFESYVRYSIGDIAFDVIAINVNDISKQTIATPAVDPTEPEDRTRGTVTLPAVDPNKPADRTRRPVSLPSVSLTLK